MNNDVNRLLKVISNTKKSIFLILIIFIAIGYLYSYYYKTPMYQSTATFVLVQNTNDNESINQKDITINQNLISTYSKIAKSNKILSQVINNLGLNIPEEELSKLITINTVKDTEVLKITVSNKDAQIASNIANELYNVFSQEVSNLYNISNIHIMDYAEINQNPYNINHMQDIIIFCMLGIIASCMYIGIIYLLDTTIKSEKDVESYTDLTVLSTIPYIKTKENNELITKKEPKSIVSESFKTLRTNIMYSIKNKKLKTILVTSGSMGEGKSFISSNLAVTFAQSGKRVLFIDTDMRKGRINEIFNIQNVKGLSNCLSDISISKRKVNINEYINKTEINNLYIMTSGSVPPNPSELLSSENMKKLLYTLNTEYDIIICDSAPTMLVTDSIVLSKIVDTVVIVTSNKTTKINNLIDTEKSIKLIDGNISGVIVNKIDAEKREYKNKYYYGHAEKIEEENIIKQEPEENILKNKLYLKNIEIMQKEKAEINTEKIDKKIEKNNKKIKEKDNSNEIKELKSLYKVLMKNTLNILLNKEEKAESILDKIDNIKNSYRNDLEIIKNNQERYEQQLLKLENSHKENKKEISKIKRAQSNTKNNIKQIKENNKKDKKEILKLQNISEQKIEELEQQQLEQNYDKELNKLREEFYKFQKNSEEKIEELLSKIEKVQNENKKLIEKKEQKNNIEIKFNANKTEEKILEMQKYINTVEEKENKIKPIQEKIESAKEISADNTIIIKELKIQEIDRNKKETKREKQYNNYENNYAKTKSKKVFAIFNRKNNEIRNNYEENIEENNGEIISQILLGTK